jgi:outer membrane murein-binding lipoprotein Lpp
MLTNLTLAKFAKVAVITAILPLGGCANLGVKPWERDLLATQAMALNAEGVDLALDDHIYFSKEATSGGRSFAGGGCGCN